MRGYKSAWEQRDEAMFAALFAADDEYHNTPFAIQRGHLQLAELDLPRFRGRVDI